MGRRAVSYGLSGPGRRVLRALPVVLVVVLSAAPEGRGQAADPREETRLLREASSLESVGDLDGARRVLERLLSARPASSGGIFALERVLRTQGRVGEVLPFVDAHIRTDPEAAAPRYLKLRILLEVDSIDALRSEAEGWIRTDPASADPYREVARVYQRAFGEEEALAVLQQGRRAVGGAALAIETGDLLMELGREAEALEEWGRAIGDDAEQLAPVVRRIGRLDPARRGAVRQLVASLERAPTTRARRRAAVEIAVEAGLPAEAVAIARVVAREMPDAVRRGFLTALARQADERGQEEVSLWAYQELRSETGAAGAAELDRSIAATSLAAGDTAAALAAHDRLAASLPVGSAERRRALSTGLRLGASGERPEDTARRLGRFRTEFPDAPELDELAADLSRRFQARGDPAAARAILEGIQGPRSALERAYLTLDGEDPKTAVPDLAAAAVGLPAADATDVIGLLGLVDGLGSAGARLAARGAVMAHRGAGAPAVAFIREGLPGVPDEERPALLALAARLAEGAGEIALAADVRAELLAAHPEAGEAPEAVLALARYRSRTAAGIPEAVRLLEELILTRPDNPVVPLARRELERLRRGSDR